MAKKVFGLTTLLKWFSNLSAGKFSYFDGSDITDSPVSVTPDAVEVDDNLHVKQKIAMGSSPIADWEDGVVLQVGHTGVVCRRSSDGALIIAYNAILKPDGKWYRRANGAPAATLYLDGQIQHLSAANGTADSEFTWVSVSSLIPNVLAGRFTYVDDNGRLIQAPLSSDGTNVTNPGHFTTNGVTVSPNSPGNVSRWVLSTANGGTAAENGANTWVKLATYGVTSGELRAQYSYEISSGYSGTSDSRSTLCRFAVSLIDTGSGLIDNRSEITITDLVGTALSLDSFKLTQNSALGPVELWMRKNELYHAFRLIELSRSFPTEVYEAAINVNYEIYPAWQSDIPSGTVADITSAFADWGPLGTDGYSVFIPSGGRFRSKNYADNFLGLEEDNLTGLTEPSNNVVLSSIANLVHSIDANNNTTNAAWIVGTNARYPGLPSWKELFRVEESGRVGIGTSSSPTAALEVVGRIRSSFVLPRLELMETDGNANENFAIDVGGGIFGIRTYNDNGTHKQLALSINQATNFGFGMIPDATYKAKFAGCLYVSAVDPYNIPGLRIENTTGTNSFDIKVGTGTSVLGTNGPENLVLSTDSIERLRVNGSTGQLTTNLGSDVDTVTALFTAGKSDVQFRAGFANGSGSVVATEHAKVGMWYGSNVAPVCHIGFLRGNAANSNGITINVNNAERGRFASNGIFAVGVANPTGSMSNTAGVQLYGTGGIGAIRDSEALIALNRRLTDGALIHFYQDTVAEGSVTVSGTTVSYNGAHLSRWSQWMDGDVPVETEVGTNGVERPKCLRGTVLSNRDAMCRWFAAECDWPEMQEDGSIAYSHRHELYDGPLQSGETYTEVVVLREAYQRQVTVVEPHEHPRIKVTYDAANERFIETTVIDVVDVEVPQFLEYPLYDSEGNPIMELAVPEEQDSNGKITQEAVYQQKMHRVPVMEDVSEETTTVTWTIVEEDNEQLNKVAVSDIQGDRDWAGVFQGYDEDDDYAPFDFYVARKGDFIVRVAAGVTVHRGDLLWSAGDGTAEPQPDQDTIGPWSIGKVVSSYESFIYPDGSRLIPVELF